MIPLIKSYVQKPPRSVGTVLAKIPIIKNAFLMHKYPITDIEPGEIIIISDEKGWSGDLKNLQNSKNYAFEPHFGWKGHIEL